MRGDYLSNQLLNEFGRTVLQRINGHRDISHATTSRVIAKNTTIIRHCDRTIGIRLLFPVGESGFLHRALGRAAPEWASVQNQERQ